MTETLGHLHPLLVHLPIGILFFACIATFLPLAKQEAMKDAIKLALIVAAGSAIASCISGYQLSLSGEYDETMIGIHQWLGIATAGLSLVAFFWKRFQKQMIWITTIVMAITGHYGGSLTHGEDFLFRSKNNQSVENDSKPAIVDSTSKTSTVKDTALVIGAVAKISYPFRDEVQPILEQKCYNCHSSVKKKGGLRLDNENFILKGGKNGKILSPLQPDQSKLYTYLLLPEEDEMHMPPKGKKQLTASEIKVIHRWIATGAVFTAVTTSGETNQPASALTQTQDLDLVKTAPATTAPMKSVSIADQEGDKDEADAQWPQADLSAFEKQGITAKQDAKGVRLNFVNVKTITTEMISTLTDMNEAISELKLGGQTQMDALLETLPALNNLKKLNLSRSDLSDKGIAVLKKFPALEQLHVYETAVTDQSINDLTRMNRLKKVFLWNTKISKGGITILNQKKPELEVEFGSLVLKKIDSTKAN